MVAVVAGVPGVGVADDPGAEGREESIETLEGIRDARQGGIAGEAPADVVVDVGVVEEEEGWDVDGEAEAGVAREDTTGFEFGRVGASDVCCRNGGRAVGEQGKELGEEEEVGEETELIGCEFFSTDCERVENVGAEAEGLELAAAGAGEGVEDAAAGP